MFVRSAFAWVDTFPSSIALRESLNAYPTLLTLHVVSMCLFGGLIALWDLRLVGVALRNSPVSEIPTRIFPWALFGFAVSVITGMLLLYSQPMRYYTNFYFWLKSGLMVLAGINMMVFHFTTYKSIAKWDQDALAPTGARVAGVASLLMWSGIVITGRLMAYSGLVPEWWKALNLS